MRVTRYLFIILYVFILVTYHPLNVQAETIERAFSFQPVHVDPRYVAVDPYDGIEQERYEIVYVMNGGENNYMNSEMLLEQELPVTLSVPVREGYNFAGWYEDSNYTKRVTTITRENAKDMVLFAKWTSEIDNYKNVEMYSYQTGNLLRLNQKELKQCEYSFMDELMIPGMPSTREQDYLEQYINSQDLCMQGLCFTPEYVIMTAYTEDKDEPGALMVFDRSTGKYLVTLGMKNDSHLGGVAFDGSNLWICHSNTNTLERISYDYIKELAEEGVGRCVVAAKITDEYVLKNTPSCITYYGGRIWVASYTKMFQSKMYSYTYDAKTDTLIAAAGYNIPCKVQGVAFDSNGAVYLSTSLGRNRSSFLRGYTSLLALNKSPGRPDVKVEMPPCSEEIAIADNVLYVLFESASTKYFEGTDGRGTSISPIDKLLEVKVASIW